MLINDQYAIFRWGAAQFWWVGSKEEILSLKNWIVNTIPEDKYGFFAKTGTLEYDETHLSGWFHVEAWTFITYYWSGGILGTNKNWECVDKHVKYS